MFKKHDFLFKQFYLYGFKPPLYFLTAIPFCLFGIKDAYFITLFPNMIYFSILLFSTYGIGNKLYNYKVGLLSAFLVSMFPTVFACSRILMVDFALMAMVSLYFYLLVLNKFESFKFSLLTGIVMGLCFLAKQSFFIYMFICLEYFLINRHNIKNKRKLRNFCFSIIIGLIIAASYYKAYGNNQYAYHLLFVGHPEVSYYFYRIIDCQLLPVFFILFILGSLYFYVRKDYFLPTLIIVFLILFSISPNKADRFILPVFPLISIIIGRYICSFSHNVFRKTIIVFLIFYSLTQFLLISYASEISDKYNFLYNKFKDISTVDVGLFSIVKCNPEFEVLKKILKIIKKYKVQNIVITADAYICNQLLVYYNAISDSSNVNIIDMPDPFFIRFKELETYSKRIENSDIIISAHDINKISSIQEMSLFNRYMAMSLKNNVYKFDLLKDRPLPYYVYVKKSIK